jgi:hypothetical protein
MSLKALAEQRLAAIRADETAPETTVKQVKQLPAVFQHEAACFIRNETAFRRRSAENEACSIVSPPKAGNGETSLPDLITGGLHRLARLPPPRLLAPAIWPRIVADALRLQSEGWAEKAFALGWEAMHLWGAHLREPGLAVWLEGRRIVAVDAESCAVLDRPGAWSLFHRRPIADEAVFLWEYGRADARKGEERGW